jgi:hypothetical protein
MFPKMDAQSPRVATMMGPAASVPSASLRWI